MGGAQEGSLSILFLRFEYSESEEAPFFYRITFNPLFEIPSRDEEAVDIARPAGLSILFLRFVYEGGQDPGHKA